MFIDFVCSSSTKNIYKLRMFIQPYIFMNVTKEMELQ